MFLLINAAIFLLCFVIRFVIGVSQPINSDCRCTTEHLRNVLRFHPNADWNIIVWLSGVILIAGMVVPF